MYRRLKIKKRLCLFSIIVFFISGCASVRHAIPPELLSSARVFGMQDIRAFSGSPSDSFKKDFIKLLEQEQKGKDSFFGFNADQTVYTLAISGGGDKGAYGAGLLCGWSEAGTRPVFRIVTGISAGAIIAPMVFLGSSYDDTLKEFYTKFSTNDIVRKRFPRLGFLFSNSFVSTRPLERLINYYINADLLTQIAAEYSKGRRLYVGTTNLDAKRLVIWDMGKIASMGDENALTLFRKIILASASIPIALPPVYLNVEANDKTYDEMHVDGGITRQVFFLYDVLRGFDDAIKEKGIDVSKIKHEIYVIRNGYVEPLYHEVPDKLGSIAIQAADTMINAQGVGDLYQLYMFITGNKGDFNLAYIPASHVSKAKEFFDPVEMQALFDLGFKEASGGYPWRKRPPGMEESK